MYSELVIRNCSAVTSCAGVIVNSAGFSWKARQARCFETHGGTRVPKYELRPANTWFWYGAGEKSPLIPL